MFAPLRIECFGSSFPSAGSRGHYYPVRVVPFQLFAPLFLVRLYGGHCPHTFAFAPVVAATCQREVNDRQQHHHESIDKERAISQHENVTENYGSHPHNSQFRSNLAVFGISSRTATTVSNAPDPSRNTG